MTIEKVCYVYPEDIKAVRIECRKCGAATIIPTSRLLTAHGEITSSCRQCHEPTGINMGTQGFQEIAVFNETLHKLAANLKGMGIRYSFQIDCPKE